jgi:hypothetical protein
MNRDNKAIIKCKTKKGVLLSIHIESDWFNGDFYQNEIKESVFSNSDRTYEFSYIVIQRGNIELKISFYQYELIYEETDEIYKQICEIKDKLNKLEKMINQ